ncbi:restriction endonuclease subunit S [Saccharopolyspora phatthalungensis]|uniref:Type I restriction enzyme S subunit n=1 Tax=Saccharopolyspora phatthalungensis TaxID=664693 RepID=A0A840Q2D5_9PSEU|nr:restriction endonuclease subunit S [Saccharopolyspora phatthalungensis]MBB5152889.1 type I restriction enzyme S subunit [Saccharopolyspora phatthalungensis]
MGEGIVTLDELAGDNVLEMGAGRPRSEGAGLPVLRVADVLEGRIQATSQTSESTIPPQTMGPKVSRPGDVVLTTKGTVGRVAIMPSGGPTFAYSPQLCYFRPVEDGPLHSRYLYYWFKSTEFWGQAAALKAQTDMADFMSLRDITSLTMTLPSVTEQRAIAEVLGALDDKIAANDHTAQLCLKLADTRFAAAVRDIPLGDRTFGDLADVFGGGTPKSSMDEYWNGDIPWATPTDVTALSAPYLFDTSRMITEEGMAACSSKRYPAGSILMTSRATIGAFAIAKVSTAVNQGFIVVNAKNSDHQWWLFHEMRARVSDFLSHANGATFLELSRGKFKQFPVRLPDTAALKSFSEGVGPLHDLAAQAMTETEKLTTTRDSLLPLLMSGKVRVRDAEKVVEEAV